MDKAIISQFSSGALILVLGIIFRAFPPKTINGLYGFRTPYSMKSQEVWDEANRYSSNLLIGAGIILSITQFLIFFSIINLNKPLIYFIFMIVLLIAIIPITELHLRKNFDKHGKRKRFEIKEK